MTSRFSFLRIFSKFGPFAKRLSSRSYLPGLALGTFTYLNYHFFYKRHQYSLMETHNAPNELTGLSKNDYFDRVLGNEKDFFFLVVFNDSEENGRTAIKVGKHLKRIADEHGFQAWNTYTINRSLFENIKKIIGRTKDVNVYEDNPNPFPIEIYLKTPHSRDYIFIPFRPNKFFEDRPTKKLSLKMKKVRHLLESISDEEELKNRLAHSLNKVNTPMILMSIDDSNKDLQKKVMKKLGKLAFMCLERKLMPFDSNFIIIKNNKLADKLGLEKNCPYVVKNDVIPAYERYANRHIDDNTGCIEVETYDFSAPKAYLKKYDNTQVLIFDAEKKPENEAEKRVKKNKEMKAFINFVLPRIVVLRDIKQRNLGQLLRKCVEDKSKYVLSLYCPSTDPNRDAKLAIFMDLYKRYKDYLIFCIIESDVLQDLFPHSKASQPSFVLFNFLNQKKSFEFGNYYKNVVYPYEKYFLNPNSVNTPDFKEIIDSIQVVFNGEGRVDALDMTNENVQELKGAMVEYIMKLVKNNGQDALIEFYNDDLKSKDCNLMINKLSDDFYDKLKFYRMHGVNTNPLLPLLSEFPKLVYVSSKHRKLYILDDTFIKDEEKIRRFIKQVNS